MLAMSMYTLLALSSEGGGGSLVDINPGLIVWTLVTFILLLLILRKVAWKPILSALDQRESAIKDSLEKAEKAKKAKWEKRNLQQLKNVCFNICDKESIEILRSSETTISVGKFST